jgi:hypothetical protein
MVRDGDVIESDGNSSENTLDPFLDRLRQRRLLRIEAERQRHSAAVVEIRRRLRERPTSPVGPDLEEEKSSRGGINPLIHLGYEHGRREARRAELEEEERETIRLERARYRARVAATLIWTNPWDESPPHSPITEQLGYEGDNDMESDNSVSLSFSCTNTGEVDYLADDEGGYGSTD